MKRYLTRAPWILAAVAGGLVLLGGTKALAATTVRCVNSTDASCQQSYSTIQAAVNAASPKDIILVGRGIYNETVTITTANLSFFGARAGMDARVGRANSAFESVVNSTGPSALAGFIVKATNVVIDGFTFQGFTSMANGSGIDLKGGVNPASGAKILNNILQNNSQALSLNFEGFAPVSDVVIKRNLFRNNSVVSGDGIFTSAAQNVIISDNIFRGDPTAAIGINNASNVTITGNTSARDGSFVIFTGTTNAEFSHNQGERFLDAGVAFSGSGGAAVAIGPGNDDLLISDNVLQNGGTKGISATTIFGPGTSQNVTVSYNRVFQMKQSGILAQATTLINSAIVGNTTRRNGNDGIGVDTANSGNFVAENTSSGNVGFDCRDSSTGGGTLGTNDTWFRNRGTTSSPTGLCTP
jgi:Right handed beta helix region